MGVSCFTDVMKNTIKLWPQVHNLDEKNWIIVLNEQNLKSNEQSLKSVTKLFSIFPAARKINAEFLIWLFSPDRRNKLIQIVTRFYTYNHDGNISVLFLISFSFQGVDLFDRIHVLCSTRQDKKLAQNDLKYPLYEMEKNEIFVDNALCCQSLK